MAVEVTMILKYHLVFFAINKLFICNAEWIEMPQFSDESKVYKLPLPSDHNSFYNKFSNEDQKTHRDYDVKTINRLLNEFGNTERNTTEVTSSSHGTENSVHFLETATMNPSNLDHIFTANLQPEEILTIETEASTPLISSTLELPTEESIVSSTETPEFKVIRIKKEEHSTDTAEGFEFQYYLPMEMLKKVHQTLKSQPSTLQGKIRFLKQFEKDLISEIETRLSSALTPPRRTRGAHDYYDHDEEMGFPSLEGALMAISFLTFAVYLIRLVMLLFRNPNNNAASATVFFGRSRRSTDILNNKTQEILNYLDTFDTD